MLFSPVLHKTAHTIVGTAIAFALQSFIHALGCAPLLQRQLPIMLRKCRQCIDKRTQPGSIHRLSVVLKASLPTSGNLAYRVARYVVILRNLANAFTISRRQSNLPDRLHHQHLLHKLPDSNTSDSMVEGGSKLHADHPRKWVIFARRFTPDARSSNIRSHPACFSASSCRSSTCRPLSVETRACPIWLTQNAILKSRKTPVRSGCLQYDFYGFFVAPAASLMRGLFFIPLSPWLRGPILRGDRYGPHENRCATHVRPASLQVWMFALA